MTTRAPAHRYLYGLDLLRFASACAVGVFHLSWQVNGRADTGFFGWVGVQVFFVISGFVIANSAQGSEPAAFVRGRLLRLYPAAWVCGILSALALWSQTGGPGVDSGNFLRAMVLWRRGPWLGTAYWTLPIEMGFYAMIFLLLFFRKFHLIGRFAATLIVASGIYLVAFGLHVAGWWRADWLDFAYGPRNITLLRHGPYFAMGIFLWLWTERRVSRTGVFCACAAIAFALLEIWCRAIELAPVYQPALPATKVFGACAGAFLGCLAFLAFAVARPDAFPRSGALRHVTRQLGLMTYPFYLMHEAVGLRMRDDLLGSGASWPVALWATLATVALLSLLVVSWAEAPCREALRRLWFALARLKFRARAGPVRTVAEQPDA